MDNEELRRAMGRRLADARTKAGMSQADLGAVIGVSGPRVSHFESGYSLPKPSYRIPLAKALKVEAGALFGPGIFIPLHEKQLPLRQKKRPGKKAAPEKRAVRLGKPAAAGGSTVNRQIIRLIETMSTSKRQLALSILRSLSRSRVLR